ncbi:MAG: hypothetical protein V8T47_02345 [Oscillospiraceae bacterium]
MGFTTQNSASHSGRSSSWRRAPSRKSPARQASVMATTASGATFDTTEITPLPPSAMIAAVWSSLPLQTGRPHRPSSCAARLMLPQASLMPAICGWRASARTVSGRRSTPVRDGTL